jgi:hypothetical protein
MKSRFQKDLKPGSRIVAHDFGIDGWRPDKVEKLEKPERRIGGNIHYHTIYLWKIRQP